MGHHTHLYLAGNAEFTFDALLGGSRLFQFVVGILQFAVGCLDFLRVLVAAMQDKGERGDYQGGDNAQHGHKHTIRMFRLFLGFHLRLVLAQLQVFVVTVQTVVLQLDGGMLQFDIAIAEFKALVLQREAQCLFLQASLFEFVADMF